MTDRGGPARRAPQDIRTFAWLTVGSLALGVVITALAWRVEWPRDPLRDMAVQAASFAMVITLVAAIAGWRSKAARWIYLVVWLAGLVPFVPFVVDLFSYAAFAAVLALAQTVVQAVGLCFLFTRDSRTWFARPDG